MSAFGGKADIGRRSRVIAEQREEGGQQKIADTEGVSFLRFQFQF